MYKYIVFVLTICLIFACKQEGTRLDGGTKGTNGTSFKIHTHSSGEKAKIGDFLTLQMQYATAKDSVIFTSYNKPKPLSFKFQPTLFKGVLSEGLALMAAGDSATFLVPADTLYGDRMPMFLKKGEHIKYTISLLKVQNQVEYQQEKMREREQSGADTSRKNLKISPNQLRDLPQKIKKEAKKQ